MLSRKNKHLLLKIVSMFSVIRGYNIPIIALAQYLSAIFILAPEKRALSVLLDFNLFIIVIVSSLTIASGYIINNFFCSAFTKHYRYRLIIVSNIALYVFQIFYYFTDYKQKKKEISVSKNLRIGIFVIE